MIQSDAGLRYLTKYGSPSTTTRSKRAPALPSPGRTSVREDARASSSSADPTTDMRSPCSLMNGERSASSDEHGQKPGLGAGIRRSGPAFAERAAGPEHVDLRLGDLAAGLSQVVIEGGGLPGSSGP